MRLRLRFVILRVVSEMTELEKLKEERKGLELTIESLEEELSELQCALELDGMDEDFNDETEYERLDREGEERYREMVWRSRFIVLTDDEIESMYGQEEHNKLVRLYSDEFQLLRDKISNKRSKCDD
jgi:hypothetical protein